MAQPAMPALASAGALLGREPCRAGGARCPTRFPPGLLLEGRVCRLNQDPLGRCVRAAPIDKDTEDTHGEGGEMSSSDESLDRR